MRKAVAIPYVIALILGVAVVGLLGYWFFAQGSKTVSAGTAIDCAAVRFNYCNGFANWDTKCGTTAPALTPKETCLNAPAPTPTPTPTPTPSGTPSGTPSTPRGAQ